MENDCKRVETIVFVVSTFFVLKTRKNHFLQGSGKLKKRLFFPEYKVMGTVLSN